MVSVFFLSSCQKDTDIFIPTTTTGADTVLVSNITDASLVSTLKVALAKEVSVDSLDASAGATILTRDGITIIVPPQSVALPNGSVATGKIFAETILIKQKGDMILMDKPTISSGRVLVCGAEIFVRLRNETQELSLLPGKTVYIKIADTNPSSSMKVFHGDESNKERFNWLLSSDGINYNSQSGYGYEISSSSLRWISYQYFADTSANRVSVVASLPADYTNANTAVYLVFKESKSVVGMYGDATSRKFTSPKVPVGKTAIVVSITKKGNNSYYFAHESVTIGATLNNGAQIVPLSPQPTGLNDIRAYLATL